MFGLKYDAYGVNIKVKVDEQRYQHMNHTIMKLEPISTAPYTKPMETKIEGHKLEEHKTPE